MTKLGTSEVSWSSDFFLLPLDTPRRKWSFFIRGYKNGSGVPPFPSDPEVVMKIMNVF